ncbi:MAG: isoprenylcysteine carboxylmethyltransferase family protein [Gemmatimonadota bacterium]|nr:MAG: isoprenylcysteine carboxylmethyltransferase family protein [Gemmatimonadota bacterium]
MLSETALRIALATLVVIDLSLPRYFKRRYTPRGWRVSEGLTRLLLPERLFTVALYAGLLAFIIDPQWMVWSHVRLPNGFRVFGIPLSVAGLAGLTCAFHHLGHNLGAGSGTGEDYNLVTTGPYRRVRHPMYSAWAVLQLGYSLTTANWCIGVLFLAAFAAVVRRIPAEEAALAARFGDAYLEYKKRTGRFIPSRFPQPRKGMPR